MSADICVEGMHMRWCVYPVLNQLAKKHIIELKRRKCNSTLAILWMTCAKFVKLVVWVKNHA